MGIKASQTKNLLIDNPKLCKEWDYKKNKLSPKEYTPSSGKLVWWICKNKHSWEARIDGRNILRNRTSKERGYVGCPYCSGRYPSKENNLKVLNPVLSKEWDINKNSLNPTQVTPGTQKKAWWICKNKHSWEASINSRVRGAGCPYCSNVKVGYGNDLETNYPEIAAEWDYEKNSKKPSEFLPTSNKKVWFICSKSHSYLRRIEKRTTRGDGCPYCSGRKIGYGNDLETNYPEIAAEWDYEKNNFLPSEVTPSTKKEAWFICSKNISHQYKSRIANRVHLKSACSYCASKLISEDVSLLGRYPEIAAEWDYKKNSKKAKDIFPGTREHFWWLCKNGHSYKSSVANRTSLGRGCPYCSNQLVGYGNDLKTNHPKIAKEWNYEKNKTRPEEHTKRSGKKVWWICSVGHSFAATIDKRVSDRGCPYCKLTPRSKEELYLLFELKNFFKINPNDTKIKLSKIESVDIKIKEIKTVIEYDGAYWHTDRALKDITKTKELEKNGWRVIRVREHPLQLINKKLDIKTRPKQYKENANKVLKKLFSLGVEIDRLDKYLNKKLLVNKNEADKYIDELLKEKTKK